MKLDADTVIEALTGCFHARFRATCERRRTFRWLKLKGKPLIAAAYFGRPLNCLFEFDTSNRLNGDRGRTLEEYPQDVPLGFDFALYQKLCAANRMKSTARTRLWA